MHQIVKENPNLDFSQTYLLVRLYEVEDTENPGIIQDIIYATNSQNPVDFRDLKSNDECQRILEIGAHDLGYVYKRKRDNTLNINVIPSTVAAEAVFAVWRESPHLAKYRRNEFFDKYYSLIFDGLNAAQMVVAVLIFRYCDNNRKKESELDGIKEHRLYSKAEQTMADILKDYFNNANLSEIDGRTMSAAFRRFDIMERYLKNETWWEENMG
ncbi:hypothetical protein E5357_14855 [Hominisplanchenecus murintestinalis]|uniref:Uncharacterized protein n=1 Tax=Hominisplanchenecus murintestinalis TaxID=2941517 RepID=A0AC61QW43_9FIRM|nr:AIPR family protein [Hominisplanchenecus murintestinalis]NBH99272.1 hypothetical protein [Lachnospiraceae bacterium]NBI76387.1 hypothetical protein [Lachnospiraceae bacterium]RKJ79600.1 hypothetical protein D7Y41_27935 [Anaerotruncus sp. 1XD22-93]TGX96807.1 hypothetical protein E5357_14855 [Hominisplanchenecus murintestinalis]